MGLRSAIALPVLFAIAGALLVARHAVAQVVHPAASSSALTERDFSRMLPTMTAQAAANTDDGNPHAGALPASALTTQDFNRMLPRTDMRSDADANAHPHAHAFLDSGTATPFDGASIAKNPLAPDAVAIGGAALYSSPALNITPSAYVMQTLSLLEPGDVWQGIAKSAVFAVLITLIGVSTGFSVQGGAEGVGRATTRAVVLSICWIIVVDMIFSYFLNR